MPTFFNNRAGLRAARSYARKNRVRPISDAREGVADDLTTTILHPTKGFRRISGKRVEVADFVARFGRAA
jgi:hypothetical protein